MTERAGRLLDVVYKEVGDGEAVLEAKRLEELQFLERLRANSTVYPQLISYLQERLAFALNAQEGASQTNNQVATLVQVGRVQELIAIVAWLTAAAKASEAGNKG